MRIPGFSAEGSLYINRSPYSERDAKTVEDGVGSVIPAGEICIKYPLYCIKQIDLGYPYGKRIIRDICGVAYEVCFEI